MKITKKHAVAILKFTKLFLDYRYYPADELEEIMIGKILGFGIHHGLIKAGDTANWRGASEITVDIQARLDLTSDESSAILDMLTEIEADSQVKKGSTDFMRSTVNYLIETFT